MRGMLQQGGRHACTTGEWKGARSLLASKLSSASSFLCHMFFQSMFWLLAPSVSTVFWFSICLTVVSCNTRLSLVAYSC